MKKNKIKQDFSQKVMKVIQEKKVKMKPRMYFILSSLLLGLGFFSSLLIAIFLINAVSFHLRIHRPFEYLHFGKPGYMPFIYNFPWLLLIFAIITIVSGILMLKKYDISYQKSFLGIITVLISLIILFGVTFSFIAPQKRFLHPMPNKILWQKKAILQDNWLIGKIVSLDKKEKLLDLLIDKNKTVKVSYRKAQYNHNLDIYQIIKMFGKWEKDLFIAKIIKPTRTNFQYISPSLKHNRINY
jgi:hypothetical protein